MTPLDPTVAALRAEGQLVLTAPPNHDDIACMSTRALELPGGLFVAVAQLTEQDWQAAAELAQRRIKRCRPGSGKYLWYTAVISEHARQRRGRLSVVR